jgi:hypothetical protein
MQSKYIVFEDQETDLRFAVIFPDVITHWEMARTFTRSGLIEGNQHTWRAHPVLPVSAGFVGLMGDKVSAFGLSESLHLKAADGDDTLLAKALGLL